MLDYPRLILDRQRFNSIVVLSYSKLVAQINGDSTHLQVYMQNCGFSY